MKKGTGSTTNPKILSTLFSDPRYRGKHVVVIDNRILVASTGSEAARIFEEQVKKNPRKIPLTTYIPSDHTLIL